MESPPQGPPARSAACTAAALLSASPVAPPLPALQPLGAEASFGSRSRQNTPEQPSAACTLGRRAPASSFGTSSLFRDTPSPRLGGTPPFRSGTGANTAARAATTTAGFPESGAAVGTSLLAPRQLFLSPPPPRYSGGTEMEPSDWALPPQLATRVAGSCGGTGGTSGSTNATHAAPGTSSAVRCTASSVLASPGFRGVASALDSPAQTAPTTTRNSTPERTHAAGAPSTPQRGNPKIPGGTATSSSPAPPAVRGIHRPALLAASPSAPSLCASPTPTSAGSTPCGTPLMEVGGGCCPMGIAAVSIASRGRKSSGSAHGDSPSMAGMQGSGDTPRNLTDWRRSLQMARRQERPHSRPSVGSNSSTAAGGASTVGSGGSAGGAGGRKLQPWR